MITGQSVWILLQPSERVRRRLREGFVARSRSGTSERIVTTLHAALLIAAHREWAEYLEEINGEIQHLVDYIRQKPSRCFDNRSIRRKKPCTRVLMRNVR